MNAAAARRRAVCYGKKSGAHVAPLLVLHSAVTLCLLHRALIDQEVHMRLQECLGLVVFGIFLPSELNRRTVGGSILC